MKRILKQLLHQPAAALTVPRPHIGGLFLLCALATSPVLDGLAAPATAQTVASPPATTNAPIPWGEIGAAAGKQYAGEGLAVTATPDGARLSCVFQKLNGQATCEGLWLTSTTDDAKGERFRVTARSVGRKTNGRSADISVGLDAPNRRSTPLQTGVRAPKVACKLTLLPAAGMVTVNAKLVTFARPGMVEEYSVSMDGLRQDFVVTERPAGGGDLRVELDVAGARAEAASYGAKLVLDGSGRQIAYSRLRVVDATGKELPARIEAASGIPPDVEGGHPAARIANASSPTSSVSDNPDSAGLEAPALRQARMPAATRLAVVVDDADATYPVRIDPTFSDANWISMGNVAGADDTVSAAVVDGAGNLYIGGNFTVVHNVIANRIARWNGSSWSALGSGMSGQVLVLAVSGSDLYAGGLFTVAGGTVANYTAKWNGSSWTALGSGMNSQVNALAVSGSDLYAGGYFTTAGSTAASRIAKWNGSSWSALGSGITGAFPNVRALAVSGSDLYAGGGFTTAGGAAANYIAKWNGSSWTALGSGMNNTVNALAVSGSTLYAGGDFTTAGGTAGGRIAKWNGSSWSALGSGMNNTVNALAVSGGDLYAGGVFGTAGGAAASRIAKWNGSSWSALPGMNNDVRVLAVSGSDLYAGGLFTVAGGTVANYTAKWNGSSWTALGSGMNNTVRALAVSGSDLYVGGNFNTAGGTAASRIAKWNGSSWSALGSGMNNTVQALAVSGSDLYAGGGFTTAGGAAANYIAKWNGSSWTSLGSGMDNTVQALAVSGSDLYAGGYFTTAGGTAATYIAKWNGSSWSALGSGMNGFVYALAVSGSELYAGGGFTTAGGAAANQIAKWNGSSWSALGSGMNSTVWALAVSGSELYAGGGFTTAGGAAANQIAKWNGSSWSALGSGMDSLVWALAMLGSDLYAGGGFTTAGGAAANHIAKWNGSSWSALGSGMNNDVRVLAVSGSDLYAGGDFVTAGGKVSAYVARAVFPEIVVEQPAGTGLTDGVSSIGFGTVNVGSSSVAKNFTIKNTGTGTLTITSVSATGGDAGDFSVNTAGMLSTISAGGSTTFSVTFSPSAADSRSTTLLIVNDDGDEDLFDIALSGTGFGPEIAVEQPAGTDLSSGVSSVAFGTVTLGSSSAAKTFTVTNSGNTSLTLSSVGVTGGNAADFSVNTAGMLASVPAGGSTTFTVTFAPGASGSRGTTVQIVNDDANEGTFSLGLSGSGNTRSALGLPASPVVVEATSAGGAVVSFSVAASDFEDGALTPVVSPASGSLFPLGDTPVSVSATDSAGATTNSSFIVRVRDTTPPAVICPANMTVNADAGQCYASGVALGSPTASDNSGSVTVSSNAPAQFPVGTNYVTWTATDTYGSNATCVQLVIVRDTQPPSLSCPANLTVQCREDVPPADFAGGSASDTCDPNPLVVPLGDVTNGVNPMIITRTYQATDGAGNSTNCAQTITVSGIPLGIAAQPQSLSNALAGSAVVFIVGATACPPVAYQWWFQTSALSGETNASLNLPNVQTSHAGNYFAVVSDGVGSVTSAVAVLTVNRAPTATNYPVFAWQNTPVSMLVGTLLTLASASDPDGDTLSLSAVSPASTNGGSVALAGGLVTYVPVTDFVGADRFSFTVSDGRGGTATADVLIQVQAGGMPLANISPLAPTLQGYLVQFAGIPGYAYQVQRAPTPTGPWTTLSQVAAGPDGLGQYEDPSPPPDGAFYRTVYP